MKLVREMRLVAIGALVFLAGCTSGDKKGDGGNTPLEPTYDFRDHVLGVLVVDWPKDGAGLRKGDWLWTQGRNLKDGNRTLTRVAVVDEDATTFRIEETDDLQFQGYIMGLAVQKSDGKILEAVAAKKGEKAKPIKIGPPRAAPPAPSSNEEEKVTVPAGAFLCTKTVTLGQLSDTTVWTAKEGDAKGLVVKWADDMAGARELKDIRTGPGKQTLRVGPAQSYTAIVLMYSDGSEELWARGLTAPFHGQDGLVELRRVRSGNETQWDWDHDAKPEIDWTK